MNWRIYTIPPSPSLSSSPFWKMPQPDKPCTESQTFMSIREFSILPDAHFKAPKLHHVETHIVEEGQLVDTNATLATQNRTRRALHTGGTDSRNLHSPNPQEQDNSRRGSFSLCGTAISSHLPSLPDRNGLPDQVPSSR